MKCRAAAAVICLFLVLTDARRVDAYIDPGSGSYILQLLIAMFFGALFALKVYCKKMKSFFRGSRRERNENREQKRN